RLFEKLRRSSVGGQLDYRLGCRVSENSKTINKIISCTLDELSCKFIYGQFTLEITGSLLGTYPRSPPIWFSDSDDPLITRIFEQLQNTEPVNYTLDRQVKMLVTQLCRYKHVDCPPELHTLCPDFNPDLLEA
ncbi:Ubiquitin-conjugating enzyme E2 Q2, partial [Paragonimus skrjabini miyazakii]